MEGPKGAIAFEMGTAGKHSTSVMGVGHCGDRRVSAVNVRRDLHLFLKSQATDECEEEGVGCRDWRVEVRQGAGSVWPC